ncbi:MAG: hypothetical protein JWQ71_1578 [Pedosphaera sp.]|nr:hypothetical protein [Pedosphaera sp.]
MSDQAFPPNFNPNPVATRDNSGLAITSLILGILSLTCFGLLSGIPAVICGSVAKTKIRNAQGSLGGSGMALAGIITGSIGTLISLAALVLFLVMPSLLIKAAPTKTKANNTETCLNNLVQIDAAKQEWALESKAGSSAIPTWNNIQVYLVHGQPSCPSGGTYTLNDLQAAPTCSIPGHKLE